MKRALIPNNLIRISYKAENNTLSHTNQDDQIYLDQFSYLYATCNITNKDYGDEDSLQQLIHNLLKIIRLISTVLVHERRSSTKDVSNAVLLTFKALR